MLVLAATAATPSRAAAPSSPAASALAPHAPIDIEGNGNFTPANGVVSGQGTAADPYVIAGWSIAAPPGIGVQFRNTAAHAVVRNVEVSAAPVAGFYLYAASNVTLENVTGYANGGEGIRIESCSDVAVVGSTLLGNQAGLAVLNSGNVAVARNNVTLNTLDGIAVTGSPSVTIQGNNVSVNGFGNSGFGVHLTSTTGDTVTGNRFFLNGIYLDGAAAGDFDSHTIPPDNLVSGLPILYERNCAGLGLSGLALGELLVANCRHVRLSNLTFALGDVGLELAYVTDATVGPNVTVTQAATGIRAVETTALRISGAQILNTAQGILLESASSVRITGTKVSAPSLYVQPLDGIAIHVSDHVNVTGSVIRHARNAVETEYSSNVSLASNLFDLNLVGLNAYRSQDLIVLGNQIVDDGSGMRFLNVTRANVSQNELLASFTDGMNVTGSSGVLVDHNTFTGNANNAVDADPSGDAWDAGYPTGGNYWSNYFGADLYSGPSQNVAGSDGIGDAPYLFSVNAADRYPLMARPVTADVPPEALFTVAPQAGNPLTVFTVSANRSSDYEDPLGLLQVRWAWDDGASWSPWTSAKSTSHRYATAGVYTIHLEVRDSAGLSDNWTASVTVTPKPDTTAPIIVSAPPTSVDVGQPLPIVVSVSDSSGLSNVTLLYRGVSDAGFTSVLMGLVNGTNFTATIPAQPRGGVLEYVIVANDSWGNEARAPVNGTTAVVVVDPLVNALALILPAALAAAVIGAAVYWLWRRRRTPPPEETPKPPGGEP